MNKVLIIILLYQTLLVRELQLYIQTIIHCNITDNILFEKYLLAERIAYNYAEWILSNCVNDVDYDDKLEYLTECYTNVNYTERELIYLELRLL